MKEAIMILVGIFYGGYSLGKFFEYIENKEYFVSGLSFMGFVIGVIALIKAYFDIF